MSTDVVVVSN